MRSSTGSAPSAALIALYEIWPKLERPERPGLFTRIGGWFIAATATSFVASLATMPFALHHFDRAALFSVVANIVSTPIITLWTTPAAALAAIAAPLGLADPFLWLMGKSLELVIWIAHYSVQLSPEVDLPRLDGAGMALAATAIALFCVLYRRGRVFALIPATAAIAVWLSAPQATGYIADDGTVFLKQSEGWTELTDWRANNGLNPLIIGDVLLKSPCPGKGAACTLDAEAGQVSLTPTALPMTAEPPIEAASTPLAPSPVTETSPPLRTGCKSSAKLTLKPATGPALTLAPCDFIGLGAAIERTTDGRLVLRPAAPQRDRPWTQKLYAPVPKTPPAAKPRKTGTKAAPPEATPDSKTASTGDAASTSTSEPNQAQ